MKKNTKKIVVYEKKTKVIYVRLLKAMYGTLTAPILSYCLFASTLVADGFVLDTYDPCMVNKIINWQQITKYWYMDDLKVSHVQRAKVKKMMDRPERKFGKMNITYGEK